MKKLIAVLIIAGSASLAGAYQGEAERSYLENICVSHFSDADYAIVTYRAGLLVRF